MTDPDPKAASATVGRRIHEARKRVGLSQGELGQRLGVTQSVVSDWERGKLESWRDYINPLARALGVTPGHFAAGVTTTNVADGIQQVEVVGEVQGGSFRLAVEYPPEERYLLPAIPMPAYARAPMRYLKVVGDSVNLLYPDGTYVLVISAADTDVRPGDKVVVYARQGELREATIKEIRVEADGRIALWPRSTSPDHQEPIYLSEEDQDSPEIAYVVIGAYRPEERPPAPIRIPGTRRA